jgi:6-phosphogluconolactonase
VTNPDVIICRDAGELSQKATERFVVLVNEASASSGRFTVALSGGSTPESLYSLLATPGFADRIPWPKVHLFWGDERCVPPDHPDSNYRMVRESLLSKISIPSENVHRMAGEKDPKLAAAEYEEQLIKFFRLSKGEAPRFDLILLGLGEDGHTASLFPESDALNEMQRLVATTYLPKLNAHRLTLTLPVLNESAEIYFLVAGKNKAAIVKELLGTDPTAAKFPAQRIQPADGALTWFITRDAAAELPTC